MLSLIFFVYFVPAWANEAKKKSVQRALKEIEEYFKILERPVWEFPFLGPGNQTFRIGLEFKQFNTTGHFDNEGQYISLKEEESYVSRDVTFLGQYGISDSFVLDLNINFRMNVSANPLPIFGLNEKEIWGAESYTIKLFYGLENYSDVLGAFDFYYRLPLFTNQEYNPNLPATEIILGDDGYEVGAGFNVGLWEFTRSFSLYSRIGFTKIRQLSWEIPYFLELVYQKAKWALSAGFSGTYSLKTSDYSENPSLRPNFPTGATYLFNSINRSYTDLYGKVFYRYSNWMRWNLSGGMRTTGVSTDEGYWVLLGIEWDFPKKRYEAHHSMTQLFDGKREKTKIDWLRSLVAKIVKVSPREGFLVIKEGRRYDLEEGMIVDIFELENDWTKQSWIGKAEVYSVEEEYSILKVIEKRVSKRIMVGHIVRVNN